MSSLLLAPLVDEVLYELEIILRHDAFVTTVGDTRAAFLVTRASHQRSFGEFTHPAMVRDLQGIDVMPEVSR